MPSKIKAIDLEIRLAYYFGIRSNLIVPNVSWGLINHECDLVILSKAGYATEIEIKISKSDLKADQKKKHCHESNKIKYLYFAIPETIDQEFALENIPERAGLLIVYKTHIKNVKLAIMNSNVKKFTPEEKFQLARLGAMRIWGLKNKITDLDHAIQYYREIIKGE